VWRQEVRAHGRMYLAGVSVRRVEDITQALWGTRVSASTGTQFLCSCGAYC
jgi:transposase-like protein